MSAMVVRPEKCDLVLSCGHTRVPVDLDQPGTGRLPDYVPTRKDGWPAAHRCDVCKRKRKVDSIAWTVVHT